MNIYEKLTEVQNELKAPKSKYNSFGKYNYRSCEDILEAVKPILKAKRLAMTVKDDVFNIGDRFYIMATVTVYDCESDEKVTTTAYAREDADKKGMDGFAYAYQYPGMNKVMQAAGRVIRTVNDKGVIALLDDRFLLPEYVALFPREWERYTVVNRFNVKQAVDDFWGQFV